MLKQRLYSEVVEALQTDESIGSPFEQNAQRFKLLQEAALMAKL